MFRGVANGEDQSEQASYNKRPSRMIAASLQPSPVQSRTVDDASCGSEISATPPPAPSPPGLLQQKLQQQLTTFFLFVFLQLAALPPANDFGPAFSPANCTTQPIQKRKFLLWRAKKEEEKRRRPHCSQHPDLPAVTDASLIDQSEDMRTPSATITTTNIISSLLNRPSSTFLHS